MRLHQLIFNKRGITLVEMMIAIVLLAILALIINSSLTTSYRANSFLTANADVLSQSEKIFGGINNEARLGFQYTTSDDGDILQFVTPDYTEDDLPVTATINLFAGSVFLSRSDGVSKILSNDRQFVEDLSFTIIEPGEVAIRLVLSGKTYSATVHSLNN